MLEDSVEFVQDNVCCDDLTSLALISPVPPSTVPFSAQHRIME